MQTFLSGREFGHKPKYGNRNELHKNLYSSIRCVKSWNPSDTADETHHGGIFNFDFSVDGSLLVAACERKSVLVFDPFNGTLIASKNNAHEDCVNCVRFLDSRTFATCSDDTTVCLWDTRYLKQPFRTLRGHSNWVKNIEYDKHQGILVTSGFDGSIYTWNINQYSDEGINYQRVFHTNGLMRSKLTPDASKLIIATAGGYLMVVHNLDLSRLAEDLQGFKPNMYRLMQMSQSPIRQGYNYNYLFTRQQNRVEFISDFPSRDEAEMIASLEIHPQGWCVVSRNISSDENSEWTCVHDIQDYCNGPSEYGYQDTLSNTHYSSNLLVPSVDLESPPPHLDNMQRLQRSEHLHQQSRENNNSSISVSSPATATSTAATTTAATTNSTNDLVSSSYVISISGGSSERGLGGRHPRIMVTNSEGEASTSGGASRTRQSFELFYSGSPQRRSGLQNHLVQSGAVDSTTATNNTNITSGANNNVEEDDHEEGEEGEGEEETGSESITPPNNSDGSTESNETVNNSSTSNITATNTTTGPNRPAVRIGNSVTFIIRSGSQERTLLLMGQNNRKRTNPSSSNIKINNNRPRLTHYVEEPNVGRGFIKEVCFSNDGRLICSPFGYGVRLLSFDPDCSELCDNIPSQPMQLHELTSNMSHCNTVVTTKFSPTHNLLVSGCLNGKVDFHQPIL